MLTMGGRRRRRRLSMEAEINLTNLIDVAFVLLIIFMITAPILQGGIEVQLPQAESTPLENPEWVVVSVAANGDVFVEKVRVADLDELESVLALQVEGAEDKGVQLKGDTRVNYGMVMQVMGRIKRMGIENVGLVLEPVES